jgi:D-alanyl-D-alanine carboxypeptidase (penicillin-binding protein 5/6)
MSAHSHVDENLRKVFPYSVVNKGQPSRGFFAKWLLCAFLALFSFAILPSGVHAGGYVSAAEDSVASYIVKETGSATLLMSKDIDRPVSPASLTKIMTCMMAIESGRMDDVVTIPLEATEVEPTKAGLKAGDRIRLRDLVKAAMVNSSNDAAFAIASYLGGSVEGFVASMNSRARALGMHHTCFTNPAGYDRNSYAGNQSTARDLMILTERAIRYSEFNTIAKLDYAVFDELETGRHFVLRTHNKLFDRYPYTVGIKTGYTVLAGPCLIARAIRDGRDMLIVMLGARTDRWSLASSMFDRGFDPDGMGSSLPVARTERKEARPEPVVAAAVVSAGSVKAVNSQNRKVVSHGVAGEGRRLKAAAHRRVLVADASVKPSRTKNVKNHVVTTARERVVRKGTVVLKAGKKGLDRKALVAKAQQRDRKNLIASKAAIKKTPVKVAQRSGGKDRSVAKAAGKGAPRRSSAQVNAAKKRHAKTTLSLSGKNIQSPNG